MKEPLDSLLRSLAGHYQVEAELGRGGMATVYLAEDLKHHRKVAIKVLRHDLAASLGSERFLREIEVTAKLAHPHILPLYDSGITAGHQGDGLLYYVMPYVEGETLRERLTREAQLPLEEALRIAHEVGDALAYAHSYGVVHRDIKPENILLQAGHAVVADFGIARAITAAGGGHLTETGLALGTPVYMSPEQSSGVDRIDGRSDIYALACVLYEMLAGEPPYTGGSAQAVFAKRLSEPVPHVSTLRETIPETVERAITKALAKTPADRFMTATEFTAALTAPSRVADGIKDRRRAVRRGAVTVMIVGAFGALAMLVVRGFGGDGDADMTRVAVLPCANRIGDTTQDYVPAGVHDEVVTGLGRIAAVEVRGRRSVLRYEDSETSNSEIARDLGVGSLVECSVYRSGDSLFVTATLRDGRRDRQLWSGTYRRAAGEVFELGADVARGVAAALQADATPTESARMVTQPSRNQEALTHYYRGRHFATSWTDEGLRRGISHLERAIALDSGFALAYAGLAEAIMLQGDVIGEGDTRPVEYLPRVRHLVQTALALDPELAAAHSSLGYIKWEYDYDWAGAVRETKRATELDPTSPSAWDYYAMALSLAGQDADAIAAGRRAVELDPAESYILSDFSTVLFTAAEYQRSLEAATAAVELNPELSIAVFNAGDASLALGDREAALDWYDRVRVLEDHPVFLGLLAGAYAQAGDRDRGLATLDTLFELGRQRYVSPRAFAAAYVGLDSLDAAMEWLIRSAEARTPSLLWDIRAPANAKLRNHPRYPELLRLLSLDR